MKKIKLLLVALISVVLLPLSINAASNEKITVHIFRGEGCGYCKAALSFFDSIKEEYGQYYKILDYETWNDANNADLLQKVGETRGENITGVPYILIGDKSWAGYDTSYDEDIKAAIKAEYEKDVADRYDIAKLVDFGDGLVEEPDHSNDAMILIIILLVAAGITYGVVVARKKTV